MPASDPSTLQEAAGWFAKLANRSVTSESLDAFRAWRRTPANRAAYEQVEQVWRSASALELDGDIQAALAAALARSAPRREGGLLRGRWVQALVGAAAIGATASALLLWPGEGAQSFSTGKGEERLVSLSDGSRVRLDTDTRLTVRLSAGERDVALGRGQAYFDVAHDPRRPFIVTAEGLSVRAVGTRFDVRRNAGRSTSVRVTLVEGSVELRTKTRGEVLTLKPGEQVAYAPGHPLGAAAPSDIPAATGWTGGHIVFHETPLVAAVAEINRYSRRRIILEAGPLASAPVSGVFDVGDTDAFIAGVATLYGLHTTTAADGAIRLASASG